MSVIPMEQQENNKKEVGDGVEPGVAVGDDSSGPQAVPVAKSNSEMTEEINLRIANVLWRGGR